MQNSIPEEWRTHDRVRHISPIGNVLNEINLKKIECPSCGKQTLIGTHRKKQKAQTAVMQLLCLKIGWRRSVYAGALTI